MDWIGHIKMLINTNMTFIPRNDYLSFLRSVSQCEIVVRTLYIFILSLCLKADALAKLPSATYTTKTWETYYFTVKFCTILPSNV